MAYLLVTMIDTSSIDSLKKVLGTRGSRKHLVFMKRPDDRLLRELLAQSAVTGVITYREKQSIPLDLTDRIGVLSGDRRKCVIPSSCGEALVFYQFPRLDYLASAAFHLITGRHFKFIWLSCNGVKHFSMFDLAGIYLTIRLSNSRLKWLQRFAEQTLVTGKQKSGIGSLLNSSEPEIVHQALRPKKILLVIGSLARGGAERQLVNTAVYLANQKDFHVEVICSDLYSSPDQSGYLADLEREGVSVREASEDIACLREGPLQKLKEFFDLFAGSAPDLTDLAFRLTCEFEKVKPDIVHAWLDGVNVAAGIAAGISGTPRIVLGCRNVNPSQLGLNRHYVRDVYQSLLGLDHVVLVNNSNAGALDYQRWLKQPAFTTFLVPNGVKQERGNLLVSDRKNHYQFAKNVKVVGTVGRFAEQKRPWFWIDVAEQISIRQPNVRFLMVGAGPLVADTVRRIEKRGLAKKFHIAGNVDDPRCAYQAMTCFLLTSAHEGLPNVLLEAQAVGIPVVTGPAGGAAEAVFDGKTGRVVKGEKPKDYADVVLEILEDEKFQDNVRILGPELIQQHFSIEQMIAKTKIAYSMVPGEESRSWRI